MSRLLNDPAFFTALAGLIIALMNMLRQRVDQATMAERLTTIKEQQQINGLPGTIVQATQAPTTQAPTNASTDDVPHG